MRRRRSLVAGASVAALALSAAVVPSAAQAFSRAVDPRALPRALPRAVPPSPAPSPAPPANPTANDKDLDRITRMQAAIREILHGGMLRKVRVGIRVVEAATGRLLFSERDGVLMDPASNQKVLATTAALMRLGADWRFRTELTGPEPSPEGVISGDVYLRGTGDPTLRNVDLDALAAALARRGVRAISGAVIADPRRLGSEEPASEDESSEGGASSEEQPSKLSPRLPLVVNHGLVVVNVRPGAVGGAAEVTTQPWDPAFVIRNTVKTKASGRSKVSLRVSVVGSRVQIEVGGKISAARGGTRFRRRVPQQALYAAVLLRAALASHGITVGGGTRVGSPPPKAATPMALLALHESAPLAVLLRKINKDSDNDYAERVLEAAGAEVYGGPATGGKGVRLLREVIGELGLSPTSYVPKNGSGLGHANRITADAMAALLRSLYFDPRVGPEILQSLSVGGVDGTTRNRFKGTIAAKHVRAKTGTLRGKSCLSGLVGDGSDVLVFSIMVEGLRGRTLGAVRGAQVGCVNAMMRYVYERRGQRVDGNQLEAGGTDYEVGGAAEGEEEMSQAGPAAAATVH